MKAISKRTFAIALAFLLSACAAISSIAAQRGRADARADLRAGKLAIETFGKPANYRPTYQRLLRERYGVQLRVVAGCAVDDSILGHTRGYNAIMRPEITRRFGTDVFDRTVADARRIHTAQRQ